ncbi:hypothetical protein R1sor_023335 [Riccia sorocarpa]|uniref:SHSP domain-containing protein n=1 Tax=Riccia sorocarpa TaxID=122646 RepID=A0ABD3GRJ2_9MARC
MALIPRVLGSRAFQSCVSRNGICSLFRPQQGRNGINLAFRRVAGAQAKPIRRFASSIESSLTRPIFGSLFDPFEGLPRSLFDQAFPSFDRDVGAIANTRVDWVETPESHVFKADLPGMKKDEIKIQVSDDGILSISGERTKEQIDENDSYRREERSYGRFYRQFRLPPNTKPDEITAKVENGVLCINVPKTEESKKQEQVRTVEIEG